MALTNLLNQVVTYYPVSSFDNYGRETDAVDGVDYPARVQQVTKTRMLPNGQVVDITLQTIIEGDPDVQRGGKIKYLGKVYRIFKKAQAIMGDGSVSHISLECDDWSK